MQPVASDRCLPTTALPTTSGSAAGSIHGGGHRELRGNNRDTTRRHTPPARGTSRVARPHALQPPTADDTVATGSGRRGRGFIPPPRQEPAGSTACGFLVFRCLPSEGKGRNAASGRHSESHRLRPGAVGGPEHGDGLTEGLPISEAGPRLDELVRRARRGAEQIILTDDDAPGSPRSSASKNSASSRPLKTRRTSRSAAARLTLGPSSPTPTSWPCSKPRTPPAGALRRRLGVLEAYVSHRAGRCAGEAPFRPMAGRRPVTAKLGRPSAPLGPCAEPYRATDATARATDRS